MGLAHRSAPAGRGGSHACPSARARGFTVAWEKYTAPPGEKHLGAEKNTPRPGKKYTPPGAESAREKVGAQ